MFCDRKLNRKIPLDCIFINDFDLFSHRFIKPLSSITLSRNYRLAVRCPIGVETIAGRTQNEDVIGACSVIIAC